MANTNEYLNLTRHVTAAKARFKALLHESNVQINDEQLKQLLEAAAAANAAETLLNMSKKNHTGGTRNLPKPPTPSGFHKISGRNGTVDASNRVGSSSDPRFRTARAQALTTAHNEEQLQSQARREASVARTLVSMRNTNTVAEKAAKTLAEFKNNSKRSHRKNPH